MAKPVVMQGTDIKNRQQDMNIRQLFLITMGAIRPVRRAIRPLPSRWPAAFAACWLVFFPQPGIAMPDTIPHLPFDAAQAAYSPAPGLSPPAAAHVPHETTAARNGVDDQGRAAWRELEHGLLFGEFQLTEGDARLTVLRIDPAFFTFTLCARSKDGGPSRALNQWGEQYDLVAAINASMYLPDGSTSTGYMRQGAHVNNGRVVQRFGAFFVAGPDEPSLPQAAILDRDGPAWRQQMDHYSLVIQNYRMINADRRILWAPGGPHYSISAVAQDGDGQILFMHCRQPVEAYSFAQQVLHLPLNVRTVMYVEGGGQAGLLVRSPSLTRELVGISPSGLLVTGDLRAVLPNVLGARRKTDQTDKSDQADQGKAPAELAAEPAEEFAPGFPSATPAAQNAPDQMPPASARQTTLPMDAPELNGRENSTKQAPSPMPTATAPHAGPNAAPDAAPATKNAPAPREDSPTGQPPAPTPLAEPGTSLTPPQTAAGK